MKELGGMWLYKKDPSLPDKPTFEQLRAAGYREYCAPVGELFTRDPRTFSPDEIARVRELEAITESARLAAEKATFAYQARGDSRDAVDAPLKFPVVEDTYYTFVKE